MIADHNIDLSLEWIAFAAARSTDEILALDLNADQILTLGYWLSENRRLDLLAPPKPNQIPQKTGELVCHCGCGETFTATWRTARPKYKNGAHKMRAYRARRHQREQAEAQCLLTGLT